MLSLGGSRGLSVPVRRSLFSLLITTLTDGFLRCRRRLLLEYGRLYNDETSPGSNDFRGEECASQSLRFRLVLMLSCAVSSNRSGLGSCGETRCRWFERAECTSASRSKPPQPAIAERR